MDSDEKEVSIEIREKNNANPNTQDSKMRETCKSIVKNMLKSRSRDVTRNDTNQYTETPESKQSPSIERKPYEMGELGDPNLWTDETVQRIIDFGEICNDASNRCKRSSIRHRRLGNFIHIMVILLGALSAVTSIGNATDEIKLIISTISGSMVAILTSIQGFLKFPQRSEVEANSCLELERMARSVRIELSKSKEFRVDPYKYIIKLENQREKILRRVGIDED